MCPVKKSEGNGWLHTARPVAEIQDKIGKIWIDAILGTAKLEGTGVWI